MGTLHVCRVMLARMQEAAQKADFYKKDPWLRFLSARLLRPPNADFCETDPDILALSPTGIDWKELGGPVNVVCDLKARIDRPDGICRLE